MGVPDRLLIHVFASQSDRRPYQYADPENSRAPLFVTTLSWAPAARPYSAWYDEVRILNSATASRFVVAMAAPLSPVSRFVMPSNVTLFAFGRCPFAVSPLAAVAGGLVRNRPPASGRTPGARTARPKKLRPLTAMFSIAGPSRVYERSPLFACSSVTRAWTVTLSFTLPTSIVSV